MYFDLNKDLKVGWLIGALVPSLIAIFVITENWAVTNPVMALEANALVVFVVAVYVVQWYQGLAKFLALVEANLRKIQQGQPVTLSPPPLRGLLKWIWERSNPSSVKQDSEQKGAPSDAPPSPTTDDILDRIRYVDQKYSLWKNPDLWLWGLIGAFLVTLVGLISLQTSTLKGIDLYIVLAVDLAAFSFLFQYIEFFLRRMKTWTIEANYTRLKKYKNDLLTQALIIMKFDAPDFRLVDAYQLNPALFTKEALIERVYRK